MPVIQHAQNQPPGMGTPTLKVMQIQISYTSVQEVKMSAMRKIFILHAEVYCLHVLFLWPNVSHVLQLCPAAVSPSTPTQELGIRVHVETSKSVCALMGKPSSVGRGNI